MRQQKVSKPQLQLPYHQTQKLSPISPTNSHHKTTTTLEVEVHTDTAPPLTVATETPKTPAAPPLIFFCFRLITIIIASLRGSHISKLTVSCANQSRRPL